MTTLVDTNVLLDIATNDPMWVHWSLHQLDAAAIRGPVLINAVVYAEFSIGYTRIEEVERVLAGVRLEPAYAAVALYAAHTRSTTLHNLFFRDFADSAGQDLTTSRGGTGRHRH